MEAPLTRTDIQAALDKLLERRATYALPRAYYQGDHRLLFASDRFRRTFGGMFQAFADNFCAPVVDTLRDRIRVESFTTGDNGGDNRAALAAAAIWRDSRMPTQSVFIHENALVESDGYVMVWRGPDGMPVMHAQHPGQVTVLYDTELPWRVTAAIKVWREGKKARLTYYTPDRTERFVTKGDQDGFPDKVDAFIPYQDEPLVPNPYGVVPVFHFPNRALVGGHGRSELTDAIPLNDAINKMISDMLVASEFVAWPQRWATGIADATDPVTGQPVPPFQGGVERLFLTENDVAKFGQFDQASFDGPVKLVELMVSHLAGVTGTPHHAFMASGATDWPSGEALKTAEARLVAKAMNRHESWGSVWEDAMRLALRIGGIPADQLTVEWRSPEARSEKADLEAAVLRDQIGFSLHQNLLELGYTGEEADKIITERQQDQVAAADRARSAFDAGLQP
jgi:hypothetical protein